MNIDISIKSKMLTFQHYKINTYLQYLLTYLYLFLISILITKVGIQF